MSWRADPNQHEKDNIGSFLKLAKKLREIKKLESQPTGVEANQQAKVAQKGELLEEILNIEVGIETWEKNDDIFALLDPNQKASLDAKLDKKRALENEKKRQKEERIKQASLNDNSSASYGGGHSPGGGSRPVEQIFVNRHERPVTDLAFDKKRNICYSSCKDKSVVGWDVLEGENGRLESVVTLCGHEGAVSAVDIEETRDKIVTGGTDGLLIWWDTDWMGKGKDVPGGKRGGRKKIMSPLFIHNYGGIIRGLRAHHEKGICLWTDKFGTNPAHMAVISYDDPSQILWKTTDWGNSKINMMLWNNVGGPKVFSCHEDGYLRVWSPTPPPDSTTDPITQTPQPKLLKALPAHEKGIISMSWHKNFLLTASTDGTAKSINCGTPAMPVCYTAKANRPLRAVAAWDFPDDKCFGIIYGGGRDPKHVTTSTLISDEFEFYQSWFGQYNTTIISKNASAGPLHRLLWIKDLGRIVSAGEDGEVKLWDQESLQQFR